MSALRRSAMLLGSGVALALGFAALPSATAEAAPEYAAAETGVTGLSTGPMALAAEATPQVAQADSVALPAADSGDWLLNAPETCEGSVCMVLANEPSPADWHYGGFRPFFTQWQTPESAQYDVLVKDGDHVLNAGSYDIKVSDTWSPFFSSNVYEYGEFHPGEAADSIGGSWLGSMAGATIYDTRLFGDAVQILTMKDVGPHDVNYIVSKFGDSTYTMVYGTNAAGDGYNAVFSQTGDNDPSFLWNTGWHPDLDHSSVPDYLIPPDVFNGLDFDPSQYQFTDWMSDIFDWNIFG